MKNKKKISTLSFCQPIKSSNDTTSSTTSLTVNQKIVIKINALGTNGEGIAKYAHYTVFIPFVCIGEIVTAQVTYCKGNIAHAKLLRIEKSDSCGRVRPKCQVFTRCGGCQLQHMSYSNQLQFKQNLVSNNLKKICGQNVEVLPTIGSYNEYAYRNKLQLPVFNNKGSVKCGFYSQNSHNGIAIATCPLHSDFCDKLILAVQNHATKYAITAYDYVTKKGLLRHVLARVLDRQLLVTIVTNGSSLPYWQELYKTLIDSFADTELGLFHSVNTTHSNVITTQQAIHLGGLKEIQGQWQDVLFTLKPDSFLQVNIDIKDKLYSKVKQFTTQLSGQQWQIIDAYSGAGLLTNYLAKDSKYSLIGIEINPTATADAQQAMQLNLLDNVQALNGDAAQYLPDLLAQSQHKNTLVILDPPRKGADAKVIKALNTFLPHAIIYISCDSATLARDLKQLLPHYEIKYCQPYDMFPQTKHVETLIYLSRNWQNLSTTSIKVP